MSRAAWCRLLILVLALPLASCFKASDTCQTCPPDDGGRIDVEVPKIGAVDSVHARLDGATTITVKRNNRGSFMGLAAGIHTVEITRFLNDGFGNVSVRSSVLEVTLGRGEYRLIKFHNDFPLVARGMSPPPATIPRPDRAPALAFLSPHPGGVIA